MTLLEVIGRMKAVALGQPSVQMVVDNDAFRLNAMPDARYGVFAYVQGQHRGGTDGQMRYSFTMMYIDRLTEDGGNEVEVQSTGCTTLNNILLTLADEMGVDDWSITTFTQRFADECAGAMAQVTLTVPGSPSCGTRYWE